MIIYFYSVLPLLFLPVDSSSIRNRNFKNNLVPSLSSSLDPFDKDANNLKVISNEPFIIQLQVPNSGVATRRSKEKDKKSKWPTKKRVSKIKPSRKRHRKRRDLQVSEKETEKNFNLREISESRNATTNAISRSDILKALSSYSKKGQTKKRNHSVKNVLREEEKSNDDTSTAASQRLMPTDSAPLVKMAYPSTPKTDKRSHKYTYKDLMADRERLEKKIKYIRNMLNVSNADDLVRVRRRSESDRTANKIAKMFLTLSAVNGLHDRLKSKCESDDDEENYNVQDVWEKERKDSASRKSSSSNEERYKVKKWIELMKSKRYSSKTCPCIASEYEEDSEAFPLEQKLPKGSYFFQGDGSSEESSETYRDSPSPSRETSSRNSYGKRRNHKARDDQDKFKALGGRGGRKLELPLDDLEVYRSKAKQILQNAEEILDRIKEEEEKRLSAPNIVMSQLKELTSRIQSDPRNNENDLIRKIQKNLGWSPAVKSPDGADGNNFLENVKSFILDPYEKAKALTDESTKKLSSYLLRNLGELQESGVKRENGEEKNGDNSKVYFEQVPRKEEEKPFSASLAREKSERKEDEPRHSDKFSFIVDSDVEKKDADDLNVQEEHIKKRMQEIIKEQEKKLNEYETAEESKENSKELTIRTDEDEKPAKVETAETEVISTEDKVSAPLHKTRDEAIGDSEFEETEKNNESNQSARERGATESDDFSERPEQNKQEEVVKHPKKEETDKEVLKETNNLIKTDSEVLPEDEESQGINENFAVAEPSHEESNNMQSERRFEMDAPSLSFPHLPSGSQDQTSPQKAEDTEGTESTEETVSEQQKDSKSEFDSGKMSNLENVEALNFSKENAETVNSSDEESKSGKGQNRQINETELKVESQKPEELIQKTNSEESLKSTKSHEENENEDLRGIFNRETSSEEDKEIGEEDPNDRTFLEDQVSKAAAGDEERYPNEYSSERELSDKEQNFTEESLLESLDDLKSKISNEADKEIPAQRPSGDAADDEIAQNYEKPSEETLNAGNDKKSHKKLVGGIEDSTPLLKATKSTQSLEEDTEVDVGDQSAGVTTVSREEEGEKADVTKNGNETLKSAINQSQKESYENDDDDDSRGLTQKENPKNQNDLNEIDDKFLEKGRYTEDEKLESVLKKKTLKDRSEENSDEEEERSLEAANNLTAEESADKNDDDTLLEVSGSQDPQNPDGTVSGFLEGKDISSEAAKSNEESIPNGESFDNKADDKSETVKAVANDRGDYNDDENSLAETKEIDDDGNVFQAVNKGGESLLVEDVKGEESKTSHEGMNEEPALRTAKHDDYEEVKEEADDTPVGATNMNEDEYQKAKENETLEEIGENIALTESAGDNAKKITEEADETSLRATNRDEDEEQVKQNEDSAENIDDDMSQTAATNKNNEESERTDETLSKAADTDENVNRAVKENENSSEEIDKNVTLKATVTTNDDDTAENDGETPVRVAKVEDANREAEQNDNTSEQMNDEIPLKAKKIDENDDGSDDEISQKPNPKDNKSTLEEDPGIRTGNSNEDGAQEFSESLGNGYAFLGGDDPQHTHQYFENENADETISRARSSEDFNNNIDDNEVDDGTPLRSAMGRPKSLENGNNAENEESVRGSNVPDDFRNKIGGESDDEIPITSFESLEDESALAAADPNRPGNPQRNSNEETSSESLRKLPPRKKSLKVPSSIAQIMKDLDGKEKDDVISIENLKPEKIDRIIGKIDEAEQQNKVTDEVDCRRECACAEDIDNRSRNLGRYEIVKDIFLWLKDLHLNGMLTED